MQLKDVATLSNTSGDSRQVEEMLGYHLRMLFHTERQVRVYAREKLCPIP